MALKPPVGEVQLNEKEISKLIKTYKKAYKKVIRELVTIKDLKVRTRRQKLSNIREILSELKVDVDDFIEREVETMYKGGALDAIKDIRAQGADFQEFSAFNRIHRQAVSALASDTQEAFLVGITGVSKDAKVTLGKAVRDQITLRLLEGKVTGSVLRQVKQNIVSDLREKGLTALIDKGGKKWTLDRYSQMIIRTKLTEARNRGLINQLAGMGYDTVIVSSTGTTHHECAVWEGRVLSMTGRTKGYPTVDEAMIAGLFHPNCQHELSGFVPELNRDYEEPTPPPKITVENLDD